MFAGRFEDGEQGKGVRTAVKVRREWKGLWGDSALLLQEDVSADPNGMGVLPVTLIL